MLEHLTLSTPRSKVYLGLVEYNFMLLRKKAIKYKCLPFQ